MKYVNKLAAAILAGATCGPALAGNIIVQGTASAGDFWQSQYENWTGKLNTMLGGNTTLEIKPFQSVVPYRETLDATAAGLLGGDMSAVSYFTGRDQVFAIIGDLIAGYDTVAQASGFCEIGGGKELLQEVYDEIAPGQIHVVGCSAMSREALVSSKPINGIDDLKGLKIRAPEGLASQVFARVGASPVALPYSEVFTSIEKGVIEAADASSYSNNAASGVHKVAKYPLFPGIHSMAIHQFIVNKAQWDALTDAERSTIEVWYRAMTSSMAQVMDYEDRKLVAKDTEAGDLTVIDWAQEDRDKFREFAKEAWEAAAAKSPMARKALDTHLAYMKTLGLLED